MIINKLKDKKGFSSILFLILCLVIIEVFAIFQILLYKTYAFNEVQGIMDITGINALYKTLNTDYFRDEYISITGFENEDDDIDLNEGNTDEEKKSYKMSEAVKNKLLNNYQSELNTYMANNGDGDIIEDMVVKSLDASIEYSSWGTGEQKEAKAQLMMDGLTEIKINSHLNMDPLGGLTHVSIFSSHSGGTKEYSVQSVEYESKTGCYVVVVRSMVRLIIEN